MAHRDSSFLFFAYKKMLGRTETRTRDRIYCQTIRTVRDISRDDRARIATCSLRTPIDRQTDIHKENYSVDIVGQTTCIMCKSVPYRACGLADVDGLSSTHLEWACVRAFTERWRYLTHGNEPNFIKVLQLQEDSNGSKVGNVYGIVLIPRVSCSCRCTVSLYN